MLLLVPAGWIMIISSLSFMSRSQRKQQDSKLLKDSCYRFGVFHKSNLISLIMKLASRQIFEAQRNIEMTNNLEAHSHVFMPHIYIRHSEHSPTVKPLCTHCPFILNFYSCPTAIMTLVSEQQSRKSERKQRGLYDGRKTNVAISPG